MWGRAECLLDLNCDGGKPWVGMTILDSGEIKIMWHFWIKALTNIGRAFLIRYDTEFEKLLDYVADRETARTGMCQRDVIDRMGWKLKNCYGRTYIYI